MRVDALAIVLRPRSMAEAADLGAALVRAWARPVWYMFLPVYAVVVALAVLLCVTLTSFWLPIILIFLAKPWLDRTLLFVLSRAVFGESTRWRELWRARRRVWGGDWLRTLFWRRLSLWRSYTQPVEQLEGQRGAARSRRYSQLLHERRGAMLCLFLAYGLVEIALCCGLLGTSLWLSSRSSHYFLRWLLFSHSLGSNLLLTVAYAAIVGALEPFYVAAGFAMYLNRRVELEAWDIEQTFRATFARKADADQEATAIAQARGETAA